MKKILLLIAVAFALFGCKDMPTSDVNKIASYFDRDTTDNDTVAQIDEDEIVPDLSAEAEAEADDINESEPEQETKPVDEDMADDLVDTTEGEPDEDLSVEGDAEADEDLVEAEPDAAEIDTVDFDVVDEDSVDVDTADLDATDADNTIPDNDVDISQYVVTTDTVYDIESGLLWQRGSGGQITQQAAESYCNNLSLAGYDDWRLPTISELRALIKGCPGTETGGACAVVDPTCLSSITCKTAECSGCAANNGPGENGNYWEAGNIWPIDIYHAWSSSVLSNSTTSAWLVNFSEANIDSSARTGASSSFARCVRSDCFNGTERVISCGGFNGNATKPQVCILSLWEDDGLCIDPDECETGTWQTQTGDVSECVLGQWVLRRATKQWGTSAHDYGSGIIIDSSNNVYVTGYTSGNLDSNINAGGDCDLGTPGDQPCPDIFLTKWNADGTKIWTKQWGTTTQDQGQALAVDGNGNIFVTGHTVGELDGNTNGGNTCGSSNPYCTDVFLTKWNSNGTKAWTKQWGSSKEEDGRGVAVNSNGDIFVTGRTTGDIDGNTNAGTTEDIYLTKWNADGTKAWTKQWGTDQSDWGFSLALDSSGNIYVTGYTHGNLDGNTSAGSDDIFLTKWNADGTKAWTKQWGTSGGELGEFVTLDSSGNIYVTGTTSDNLDGNTTAGAWDVFLTKWNADGTKAWTKQWGTSSSEEGYAAVVNSSNDIFVTGYTQGEFDGNLQTGTTDIFLTKLSDDGVILFSKQWGATNSMTYSLSMIVDAADNIYMAGTTDGELDGYANLGLRDIFFTEWLPE